MPSVRTVQKVNLQAVVRIVLTPRGAGEPDNQEWKDMRDRAHVLSIAKCLEVIKTMVGPDNVPTDILDTAKTPNTHFEIVAQIMTKAYGVPFTPGTVARGFPARIGD